MGGTDADSDIPEQQGSTCSARKHHAVRALYGKDVILRYLRAIGDRAFVHVETHTRKLDPKAWEGRLCGYSMDSKSFRIYNPAKGNVRKSRNVIFIETPPYLADPGPCSGLTCGELTYEDNADL